MTFLFLPLFFSPLDFPPIEPLHLIRQLLSSPRADRARAVTGRRCPHSGKAEGGRLFDGSTKFFYVPGPLSFWVIFLMTRTVPPSFVEIGPKLRVVAHLTCFNTKKMSHWNPDMRVPKFLLPAPKKLDFWPKNGQIWPKTGILGQISAFLAHLI